MLTFIVTEPAVAGRNAEKAKPAYVHWPTYHGLPTPAPRHTKAAMSHADKTAAGPSTGVEMSGGHGGQAGEEASNEEGKQQHPILMQHHERLTALTHSGR